MAGPCNTAFMAAAANGFSGDGGTVHNPLAKMEAAVRLVAAGSRAAGAGAQSWPLQRCCCGPAPPPAANPRNGCETCAKPGHLQQARAVKHTCVLLAIKRGTSCGANVCVHQRPCKASAAIATTVCPWGRTCNRCSESAYEWSSTYAAAAVVAARYESLDAPPRS